MCPNLGLKVTFIFSKIYKWDPGLNHSPSNAKNSLQLPFFAYTLKFWKKNFIQINFMALLFKAHMPSER